jgi:SAM-dependent methyltransferase
LSNLISLADPKNLRLRLLRSPSVPNETLKVWAQCENSISILKSLQLTLHPDLPKNWDSLAALIMILKHTSNNACIMDAGGEYYSSILPLLRSLGYKNLIATNLSFVKPVRKNKIRYEPGDITQTRFQDNTFDAVTSLSVIEHGVDIEKYFSEMSRIIKPNGILFTSTDYWKEPVDTRNQIAFDAPIKIFTKEDILTFIDIAKENGFTLLGELDLTCVEKVVHWQPFDLRYTFIYFTLQKQESIQAIQLRKDKV